MTPEPARFVDGPNGRIAVRSIDGEGPTGVWLGGFKSDMLGGKAEFLARWATESGQAYLRFDYTGHGESDGAFEDGTISTWAADALHVIDTETTGPLVLVGSSMGGWMALISALERRNRVAGLVLIAPAPDFTEELRLKELDADERETLERDGRVLRPSDYGEPYVYTKALFESGRNHLLLGGSIDLDVPIRILQGYRDEAVPWPHAMRLLGVLKSSDATIHIDRHGDHRLSEPHQLWRLQDTVAEVVDLAMG